MRMNEKEFVELLNKATYFAAFSMLGPEYESGFKKCMQDIRNILRNNGDTYSDEIQEWGLNLLLREAVDDYIAKSVNDILVKTSQI